MGQSLLGITASNIETDCTEICRHQKSYTVQSVSILTRYIRGGNMTNKIPFTNKR